MEIDEDYVDGHFHKCDTQSMLTGEVKSVFKNDIFHKSSSAYKGINYILTTNF
jgi:hypothetical protein